MNLGILKCDTVRAAFAPGHGQYPEMFATLLNAVDPAINYTVFDVEHGEFPQNIDDVDVYLITGSRHGVNDGFPWIAQLEELVRTLYVAQKKVIGICFGHQLIAKALGGQVIKSPNGWGVGMSQNKVIQQKKWMNPSQKHFNLLVSHQDQVIELPKGAEVLAASNFCPYYMLQLGTHFLTLQGHPEFTKAYCQDLIKLREDTLSEKEFTQGLQSLAAPEDDQLIASWIINFLRSA